MAVLGEGWTGDDVGFRAESVVMNHLEDVVLFENAPIALWLEDFSEVKKRLDGLRAAGVADLAAYLSQHPHEVDACMACLRVLDVNPKTLELFGAQSKAELIAAAGRIFRDDMRLPFRDELLELWAGKRECQCEGVNYALNGEAIEILLHLRVLPGSEETLARVLVSIEDLRQRKRMETELRQSEAHFRSLFARSPVSLWEEDYSQIKAFFAELRAAGVENLAEYLAEHPGVVEDCMKRIRILDVNLQTLRLFGADSLEELKGNLERIFRDEMRAHFAIELVEMWNGSLYFLHETVNYNLQGDPLDIELAWSVLPGCEDDFSRVIVSLNDITARKQTEHYMQYLGTHDALTGLYNRHYFQEECKRLQNSRRYPVSFIMLDIDDLKQVNDAHGHIAGDDLLRRAAEVMRHSFRGEDLIARLGGDEFAVILPETDETAALAAMVRIEKMLAVNNAYYRTPVLRISVGTASGGDGSVLDELLREADDRMYRSKRQHKLASLPANEPPA